MTANEFFTSNNVGDEIRLNSPTIAPKASGYLWNPNMMIQINCRGYAIAQHMQPEPAKYSYGPALEAKTFIQPEHHYHAQHAGRFFYLKDESTGEIFSVPYEPVRKKLDQYCFTTKQHSVEWDITHDNLTITLSVSLHPIKSVELWSMKIKNSSSETRHISLYSYFSIGYMSWMNQGATFDDSLNAVVAKSVTPYQLTEDYPKQKNFKDMTFLLAEQQVDSWTCSQTSFEGEGGLHNPDGLIPEKLPQQLARYELPVAVTQHKLTINPNEQRSLRFAFGCALNTEEINALKQELFVNKQYDDAINQYKAYLNQGSGCISLESPDTAFNQFVNHWLPRQMYYHGGVNRLTTDPQTRNYLQDGMGMCFINPNVARKVIIKALGQQHRNGEMPDGILLHDQASLKYINQVPHTDHSVWLPIVVRVYLDETNDVGLLKEQVGFKGSDDTLSVREHISLALDALLMATDKRGLSYINQGDWCDPMNMVGPQGKGVSSWLSLATAYVLNLWCETSKLYCKETSESQQNDYQYAAKAINKAVNKHLWHGDWFARGITDNGRVFGTNKDSEGKIYLNPQTWSMLSGAANSQQINTMLQAIDDHLQTPYGVMMLAPSYTKMHEDVGRLTQKYPGVAENGSVYNHAAAFYAFSLFTIKQPTRGFNVLKQIIPSIEHFESTGQLPNFIPNYYRGAYETYPEVAGRSSHLFNTGTIAWFYHCVVNELCGVKGEKGTIVIRPNLPSYWKTLKVKRQFNGAMFNVNFTRTSNVTNMEIDVDGQVIEGNVIKHFTQGQTLHINVKLPVLE